MKEKRKISRRHLYDYFQVFDLNTNQILGHLIDISFKGLKLETPGPIDPGKTFHLAIRFPEDIRGKKYDSNFIDVQSNWCNKNQNSYETGFNIMSFPPGEEEKMMETFY